jgi:hypothetical protein
MTTTLLSPQDLFQLQRELDNHRERNNKDMQRRMDITRLQNEVYEAQQAIGGQVFRIPAERIPALQEKIEKLAKRYDKLGLDSGAPTFTDTGERENEKHHGAIHEWAYVLVSGHPPCLNGWTFVATLQHEEAGTILRAVPGFELDLGDYRQAIPECQHCGYRRHRKDTYVVWHEENEAYRQVGRNCLADFIGGLSPERAAKGFEFYWDARDEARRYQREGFTGFRPDPTWDLEELLTHTAWAIREYGWVSKSAAWSDDSKRPTADVATSNLYNMTYQVRDKQAPHDKLWEEPSEVDAETARKTIEYVRNEMTGDSDYVHNLKIALGGEAVKTRNSGLACSAVFCYKRHADELVKRAEEAKTSLNEYVGQIKERLELRLKVVHIIENYNGGYGYNDEGVTYIHKLKDEQGRSFTWFGTYRLENEKTYEGRWTVKKHEEYKGTKQTIINRPAKLEEVNKVES